MLGLPLDVWAMMLFSIAVFFGTSIWALTYSLLQEERKMRILEEEGALDTYSPRAVRDLKAWLQAHPRSDAPAVKEGRQAYRECIEALRSTNRHFYDWTQEEIDQLETVPQL